MNTWVETHVRLLQNLLNRSEISFCVIAMRGHDDTISKGQPIVGRGGRYQQMDVMNEKSFIQRVRRRMGLNYNGHYRINVRLRRRYSSPLPRYCHKVYISMKLTHRSNCLLGLGRNVVVGVV